MKLNNLENALIVLGASFGLAQIETILGIIILVFQIGLIIFKGVMKVKDAIEKEEYENIDDYIEDTIEDLKGLDEKEVE